MFTRLAIQAKSYDMAFHFPQPFVVRLTTPAQPQDPSSPPSDSGVSPVSLYQDPIPEHFSSVLEARFKWDALAERIFRFTETMFNQTQSSVMGILPTSVRQYGALLKLSENIGHGAGRRTYLFTQTTVPLRPQSSTTGLVTPAG